MMPWLSAQVWRRYLNRNSLPSDELASFAAANPQQQRQRLSAALHQQILYFGQREDALPEWKEAARIQDPDALWRVWPQLPVLTKTDLRQHFPAQEMQTRFGIVGRVDGTGGSTGEPMRFLHDRRMVLSAMAAEVYTRTRMGWKPGMPIICVWGSDTDIGKPPSLSSRLYSKALNEFFVDGYRLGPNTLEKTLRILDSVPQATIYGFTSMLDFLATELLRQGRTAPGKLVSAWNGGEMLFDEQSARFQQAFGVPILNRYGGRELGAGACQFAANEALSVLRPWLYLEIVDEHGKPVPAGQPGRILWTSTICRGTPFLRYEIGDVASFEARGVDESGIHTLARLEGRTAGLLTLPDGRRISGLFWNHAFKGFPEIAEFQVIVRSTGLEILLNGAGFTTERDAECQAMLRGFLGASRFEIRWVEQIPRTKRGKLMQVVQA